MMQRVRAPARRRTGPYELGERLGSGGMAEVYIARRAGPHGFSKRFAVKVILPQLARDPHFVSMFCDEARICSALSHPNIVQVVDFGESDGELFMAMEFVDGLSLAKLLRAVASRGERFPLGAALFITHEVLRALAYAHRARDDRGRELGIVHRDVSPGNILIGRAGEVKLTDFGIVRSAYIDRRTYPGELKGKIGYMSPEQALGSELDARSDLFTIGIVLAEMLLARPLFPGKNELEILSRIHGADLTMLEMHGTELRPDLLGILRRALQREPKARFESAQEFADALRQVARDAGIALNDTELVPWLSGLGVLPSVSGFRPALSAVDQQGLLAAIESLRPTARLVPSERPTEPRVESRYEVELGAGHVLGPLRRIELLERLVTGHVASHAPVSVDGALARPIVDLPGLGPVARRPSALFGAAHRGMELARAAPLKLPGLLFAIADERRSGLLLARSGRREKRIWFRSGSPVRVASTDKDELLGQRLVAESRISADALERALERALDRGERLGAILIEQGVLRGATLARALHEQLEDRIGELSSWHRGEIGFALGERAESESTPLLRNPIAFVTRIVRASYSDRDVHALFRELGNVAIAPNPLSDLDARLLGLDFGEERAFACAPGSRNLKTLEHELARSENIEGSVVRRAVFIGLSAGLFLMPGWR
jgi:eukaryotic-like serine/threonine-protein kinase